MKKVLILSMFVGLFVMACNTSSEPTQNQPTAQQAPNVGEEDKTKLVNKLPDENDEMARVEKERVKRELTATVNNVTSPYRYVISSDQFTVFAELVKASTLSKHIHSGNVTLLAPKNEAFDGYDYEALLKPENSRKLDDFVASYILDKAYDYKALKEEKMIKNHLGNFLRVNTEGSVTIEGAGVTAAEIPTNSGVIIAMLELYYKP
jgi:uncharacterized surface protein with fasciclin (FAS1) repeats